MIVDDLLIIDTIKPNLVYTRMTDINLNTQTSIIGAYVITHNLDNIHAEKYVGSTRNLNKRISGHKFNKEIIYVEFYEINDIYISRSIERILMNLIKPNTNINISCLNKYDTKLMNLLLENYELRKRMTNNSARIGYRYLNVIKNNKNLEEKRLARQEREIDNIKLHRNS